MRKYLCFILSVYLCFTISVIAFAESGTESEEESIEEYEVQSDVSIRAQNVFLQLEDQQEPERLLLGDSRSANDYGYYIDIDSSLGNRLFVPSDYAKDSFCIDTSGNLIGTRNSSFSCYMGNYTVRFPAYSSPQYRLTSGTGYTWTDIDIEYIDSPNVAVLGAKLPYWDEKMKPLLLLSSLGVIFICLLFKRW